MSIKVQAAGGRVGVRAGCALLLLLWLAASLAPRLDATDIAPSDPAIPGLALVSLEHLAEITPPLTQSAVDLAVRFVVLPATAATAADGAPVAGRPVHIAIERPGCSCTTISLDQDAYPAGASGVIHVHFEIGQFHGLKEIDLVVHAERPGEHPQQQVAHVLLRIQVPQVVRIEPQHLEWGAQDTDVIKTMTFTAVDAATTLTTWDPVDPAFQVVPERCTRSRGQVVLAFRRVTADRRVVSPVRMHADVGGGHVRESIGYLVTIPAGAAPAP